MKSDDEELLMEERKEIMEKYEIILKDILEEILNINEIEQMEKEKR